MKGDEEGTDLTLGSFVPLPFLDYGSAETFPCSQARLSTKHFSAMGGVHGEICWCRGCCECEWVSMETRRMRCGHYRGEEC